MGLFPRPSFIHHIGQNNDRIYFLGMSNKPCKVQQMAVTTINIIPFSGMPWAVKVALRLTGSDRGWAEEERRLWIRPGTEGRCPRVLVLLRLRPSELRSQRPAQGRDPQAGCLGKSSCKCKRARLSGAGREVLMSRGARPWPTRRGSSPGTVTYCESSDI